MALTRKLLKSLGLEEAQIETIIDAHTETVDGLKESLKTAQTEAAKVEGLTQQLNEANDKLSKAGDAAKVQKAFDLLRLYYNEAGSDALVTEFFPGGHHCGKDVQALIVSFFNDELFDKE